MYKEKNLLAASLFTLSVVFLGGNAHATTIQLFSPAEYVSLTTTIDFDASVQLTVVNNLYAQQEGITFYRDDGQPIPILDWAESGRTTTSPNNVIATISGNFLGVVASQYVLHLNAAFSGPTFELGAFFGNDQPWGWDYTTTTLSVFGADANFLGSVSVDTNSNTSVDQFIGLRSDVAFHSARFENNGSTFAVVLDDISFGSEPLPEVPEPATIGLLGMGIAGLAARMRRKKSA